MLQSAAATTPSAMAVAMFGRRPVTSPTAHTPGIVVCFMASTVISVLIDFASKLEAESLVRGRQFREKQRADWNIGAIAQLERRDGIAVAVHVRNLSSFDADAVRFEVGSNTLVKAIVKDRDVRTPTLEHAGKMGDERPGAGDREVHVTVFRSRRGRGREHTTSPVLGQSGNREKPTRLVAR
jgi:hypothetical protein